MKIGIFGMGYVGVVSAACLLRDGHEVFGIDLMPSKVDDLNLGRSPIREPGVGELLEKGRASGRLLASTDARDAVREADMVWICVGTPSRPDGSIALQYVEHCAEEIGTAMRETGGRPLVVVRSTSLPGTTRSMLIPTLEKASGLSAQSELRVVFHPEFLREGSAIADFDHPPKIVIGEHKPGEAAPLLEVYERYEAPRFETDLEVAELVKYSDNSFHALKTVFANEMGSIARSVGADARLVQEIFCADTKLNISRAYLRPGFAFGGSCLPKDLRAIIRFASSQSIALPVLESALASNTQLVDNFVARVLRQNPKSVGLVGLAFKQNTDDMRESPYVRVAKQLLGEGVELRIFDPGVDPNRLIGANLEAVRVALRHLEPMLVSTLDDLDSCETIVINHNIVEAARVEAWLAQGIGVHDVVGIEGIDRHAPGYEGIAW
ncbi:MAG TPA: nucleotide sugar dehydrogenase [Kiloniellaceae bacterium]|nr:nucleotide sugar dehydrogenase [Kiloniellaceae bacterium]